MISFVCLLDVNTQPSKSEVPFLESPGHKARGRWEVDQGGRLIWGRSLTQAIG